MGGTLLVLLTSGERQQSLRSEMLFAARTQCEQVYSSFLEKKNPCLLF